jgi:hypothetical protein
MLVLSVGTGRVVHAIAREPSMPMGYMRRAMALLSLPIA